MDELLRRASELHDRCESACIVTHTAFLTPAEAYAIECRKWDNIYMFGDERKVAFFLPYYMNADELDAGEYISAIAAETKFASPSHRDYLGAILALGIKRECVGDIYVDGETAQFYVLRQVKEHILMNLDRVGRYGAKLAEIELSRVKLPEREYKELSFTVKSPRLDAVAAGMFSLSRTGVLPLIEAKSVSLNYSECTKPDAQIEDGDIISIRGYGKGRVSFGGVSKKDRLFITAEIYK